MSNKHKKPIVVIYKGEDLSLDFNNQYFNNRQSIRGYDKERLPQLIVTVNLPDEPLDNNQVFIKNYAENEGILECLVDYGIVKPISKIQIGYVTIDKCQLLKTE